jgi:uncharacterized membrane-anchored protein YhcB (DUF1043 family)
VEIHVKLNLKNMNKVIIIIAFVACSGISSAQSEKLNSDISIEKLKTDLKKTKSELDEITAEVNRINKSTVNNETKIKQINSLVNSLKMNVDSANRTLENKITLTETNSKNQINVLGSDVDKNRLYWIIATLVTLLLGVLMYLFLGKRIKSSQTDVETQIRNTKKSLEEESLKLDNKLIEVLETQMKVQQEESRNQPIAANEKADHSLALKVADEIVRMQKNISRMDADIKGLKPLEKGIERIQANFAANGYEMVNLLNSEYDERMNIDVINFVEDDTLESGKKLISKIIKPQINFNGILIQRAQVEISQN